MKKIKGQLWMIIFVTLVLSTLFTAAAYAESVHCSSVGGPTGLITTPTAHTGWEGNNNIGLDFGYHYIGQDDGFHIPKATVQLFGKWEIGGVYDMQQPDNSDDIIIHTKFKFYGSGSSALAVGGNYQALRYDDNASTNYQIYIAATYSGTFFSMPAETSMVVGKTFGDDRDDSNIDFSMGFDLDLLPDIFKHYAHWINDFSNYSYSMQGGGSYPGYRACFNTGVRIAILRGGKYKLNIDAIMTDVLDEGSRHFIVGASGGLTL